MKSTALTWLVVIGLGLGSMACSGGGDAGTAKAVCGDGKKQSGEECDDGNEVDDDGCSNRCKLPRCGDGIVQKGEQCDDGNLSSTDQCTVECRKPVCGDGFVQKGEQCDDGNLDSHDSCLASCKLASCGDGSVEIGVEQCDDGNTEDGDGCTKDCRLPGCGNGIEEPGEECDDGDRDDGDACLSTCQRAFCGDGRVERGKEACDDGNSDDNDGCRNDCSLASCGDGVVQLGVEACDDGNDDDTDGCTSACRLTSCGDGIVQPPEECDDGNTSNTDACLNTCQAARCGDGWLQIGEEACDDGNLGNHDGCLGNCTLASCGDGVVEFGVEGCDDGDTQDGDGCTGDCRLPECGDGILGPGEACDDGNRADGDACLSTCQNAFCGDGRVQVGVEACDDGNRDDHDGCRNDCSLPFCGDGVVQLGAEACDDGDSDDTDGCTSTCRLTSCGDGVVQPPEQCDDGNTSNEDGCLDTCQLPFCGDGWVRQGVEECDDGNRDPHDGCTASCTKARCGDGIVQPPEQCDDGNASNADGCLTTCRWATCGDGYVQAGVEQCDDGNPFVTDACLPTCARAHCGDGVVWAGMEACDDGNTDDSDACRNDCRLPTCGDGIVQQGEECDDGNFDNTDGCLFVCLEHDFCKDFQITAVSPPMACLTASPTELTLTASGDGFFTVNGEDPAVLFDGTAVSITDRGGCAPIHGVLEEVETCSQITIALPDSLALGIFPIEVNNPITLSCPATATFSMASDPTISAVEPAMFCEGRPLDLTLTGADFVPSTEVTLTGSISPTDTTFESATSLVASFEPLLQGTYDVTVSNGAACTDTLVAGLQVFPQPRVFFVDPPVVYDGISVQGTVYVSGINGDDVVDVAVRPHATNRAYRSLDFTYEPTHPKRIQAVFPSGLDVGFWDIRVTDQITCTAELPSAFRVVDDTALTLALGRIVPAFGYELSRTGVTLYTSDPIPTDQTGFFAVPSVYLNPVTPGPDTIAARLSATSFVAEDRVNAVVPAGLPDGQYDVIVVNPDGTVGILSPPEGFTVTSSPPPVVDAISPVSVPNNASVPVVIYGSGFDAPTVELQCKGVATPYSVAVSTWTPTEIHTLVAASQLAIGSVCVVRVTNPDGSYGDFSALGATEPAENLMDTTEDPAMNAARRAPSVVIGSANEASTFLYAFGGDSGTAAGALSSIEAAPLDRFGTLGAWRTLSRALPSPRTLARAEIFGRYLYIVGGNTGAGPVASVVRAEILDPLDAPAISDVALELGPDGLEVGVWYYTVSAVLDGSDADNPGGETLPSDPQAIVVPAGLAQPLEVTIYWTPVAGATHYRVFRSPEPGAPVGSEEFLDEVDGSTHQFVDSGADTADGETALVIGDLGVWQTMPTMDRPREGFGLAKAQDPVDPDTWYLYAVAGRTTSNGLLATYEVLPIDSATGLPPSGAEWTEVTANPLVGPARWQLGAMAVDKLATTRVAPGDTWIYAGSGANAAATMAETEFDAALVQAGGTLGSFIEVDPLMSNFAGYGYAAVANQIWVFGGGNLGPDDRCRATQICGGGVTCAGPPNDPPDLQNWDAGFQFSVPRYLLGSAAGSGRIFLVGGLTGTSTPSSWVPTNTVESTVW
jgi:cysteine-rich repeat protein